MPRGRLAQIELWDAPPAQSGASRILTFGRVSNVRWSEAINNDEGCSFQIPLNDVAVASLVERQVLVLRFDPVRPGDPSTSKVYRYTSSERVHGVREAMVRLVGRALIYDLASAGPVYSAIGGVKTAEFSDALTPTAWITTYVLPALARWGYTYVTLGDVDPTETVPIACSHHTGLTIMEELGRATTCEFQLRDTGELDLVTAINGALTRRALSEARNLPKLQVTRDALPMANAIVPIGRRGHDAYARGISHVPWKITAIDVGNLDITIASADGGTVDKLIGFDGQYTTNSGLAANWWLTSLKDRRAYQISNSYVASQKLRIASTLGQLAVGDYIELRQSAAFLTRSDWGSLPGHYPARISAISTNQLTLTSLLSGDPVAADDVHLGQRCQVSALQATTTCSAVANQGAGVARYTVASTTGMLAGDWGFLTSAGAEPWGVVNIFQITAIVSGTQFDARFKHSTKNDGVTPPDTAPLTNCRVYRPRAGVAPYVTDEVASTNVVTVDSAAGISVNDVLEYFCENLGDLPYSIPAGSSLATYKPVEKAYARDDLRGEANLALNHNPRFDVWTGASNVPPDGYIGTGIGKETLAPIGPGVINNVNIANGFLTNARPFPWIPSAADRTATARVWFKTPSAATWTGSLPRVEVSISTAAGSPYAKLVIVPVGSSYSVLGEFQKSVVSDTIVEADVTFEVVETGIAALVYLQGFYVTVQSFNCTVTLGGIDVYQSSTPPEEGYSVRYAEGNKLVGEVNKKLQVVHVPTSEYVAGVHDWSRLIAGDADLELMKGAPVMLDNSRVLPSTQPVVRIVRIDWNEDQPALTQIWVDAYADRLSRILGVADLSSSTSGAGGVLTGVTGSGSTPGSQSQLARYNVKDYGAEGDGVTNDYAAIAAAITAAGSSGVVYFPAGTYMTGSQITQPGGVYFEGDGEFLSIIRATAAATMQDVVFSDSTSLIGCYRLTVDANGGARNAYTGAMEALRYQNCTDYVLLNVVGTGARGPTAGGSGVGLVLAGSRGTAINCRGTACGSAARPADGVYCATTLFTGANYLADDCVDTGWVFENSQFASLTGFAMRNVGCGIAITSNTSSDLSGNSISDGTIEDWDAAVSGAIQLGTISTGNLRRTKVSNVIVRRTAGSGPALNIRQDSTGETIDITLEAIQIDGASTQGMLLRGRQIAILHPIIRNCTSNAVQLAGCTDVDIFGGRIESPSVAVYVDVSVNVKIQGTHIVGTGGTMTHGVYFNGDNSNHYVHAVIENPTVGRVGRSVGGSQSVWVVQPYQAEAGGWTFGMLQDAGMYRPLAATATLQLIGTLSLEASTSSRPAAIIPQGATPSSPSNDWLWHDATSLYFRKGGTNHDLLASGGGGGGGATLTTVSVAFTDQDTARRVTITDGAVSATSKIAVSVRRPDTASDGVDPGWVYIANVVRVATGAFDVLVIALDVGGDDPIGVPPNETITLTYLVTA